MLNKRTEEEGVKFSEKELENSGRIRPRSMSVVEEITNVILGLRTQKQLRQQMCSKKVVKSHMLTSRKDVTTNGFYSIYELTYFYFYSSDLLFGERSYLKVTEDLDLDLDDIDRFSMPDYDLFGRKSTHSTLVARLSETASRLELQTQDQFF